MDKNKAQTNQQSGINLQNHCRTCGNSTEELLSIFDDEGLGYELNIKISTYLHIQVTESDTLPLNVCIDCATTLLSFHELYVCCLKAKEYFQSISLTNDNHLIKDEDASGMCFSKRKRFHSTDGQENNVLSDMENNESNGQSSLSTNTNKVDSSNFQENSSCQHCTQHFRNKNDLIEHLKDIHTDLIFLCDVCKDYLPRNDLLAHMTSHAISLGQSHFQKTNIQCEKCNKIFQTDIKYQRHIKVAHRRQPKIFQCSDCDKTFKNNRVLTNHMNHKHSNKRKYKCDICQKSFKADSGLYAHRKTHTEPTYSCQVCLKKFKFKVHLSRHLTMHSQEKNYFCRFCSKSFGVKDNLNKHLKTHYKLFEFKCHICDFLTSQRRYLAMHMKTSHLVQNISTFHRQSYHVIDGHGGNNEGTDTACI